MATAVVSGATSGIGRAIAAMLQKEGYEVIGIGRDFSKVAFDEAFIPLVCDLSVMAEIESACGFLAKERIDLLVNAAGFGAFDPLEESSLEEIERMIAVNLQAPIALTHLLLRSLKAHKGTIINISSIEAVRSSRFASIYSATKSGLRAFGQSLFEEVRKSGVKVVTINPDVTDTPFFEALRFAPHTESGASIDPQSIAKCVQDILALPEGTAVTELTIRPQIVRLEKRR